MQTRESIRLFLLIKLVIWLAMSGGMGQDLENWVTSTSDSTEGPVLIQNDTAPARPLLGPLPISCCENGWVRYENSCYFAVRQRMNFDAAEHYCYSKSATLFVADSMNEWDTIKTISPNGFVAWIGLANFGNGGLWQTVHGMDPDLLPNKTGPTGGTVRITGLKDFRPWSVKYGNNYANGWTQYAICGGYFNPVEGGIGHVRYYVCTQPLFSICERNITHINLQHYLYTQKKLRKTIKSDTKN